MSQDYKILISQVQDRKIKILNLSPNNFSPYKTDAVLIYGNRSDVKYT